MSNPLVDFLNSIPEDEGAEEWSVPAAAFIGTLAFTAEDIPEAMRMSALIMFARTPTDILEKASKLIDDTLGEIIEASDEYQGMVSKLSEDLAKFEADSGNE